MSERLLVPPPLERLLTDDWTKCRVGDPDVATLIMGQSPDSGTYNAVGIGLPFFQGKMDFGIRHPTTTTWCSSPSRIAERGDILVSVRAPVGDANIATEKCCIGRGIAALRPGPKTDGEFLFYLLLHHKSDLDRLGSGAIFKAINKDTLHTFEIQVPPLPEQRAIAAVLSKIQAAVEVQEKIVATLKELKAATTAKLLREGLRGEPLKQTEIGEIPESWILSELREMVEVRGGKRLPKGEPFADGPTPFPYIRIVDLKDNRVDISDLRYLMAGVREKIKRYIITTDDVYISIAGTTGLVGVIPDSLSGANLTENAARLVIKSKARVNRDFLMWFLAGGRGQDQMSSLTMKTSQPKLALSRIETIKMPVPDSLDEQIAIANAINKQSECLFLAVRRRDALKGLFSSMLHLLMTGQVRVNELLRLNEEEPDA